jgi:hypothetical protein
MLNYFMKRLVNATYFCTEITQIGRIKMTLEELVSTNRYPIVFIGSGISKRYLSGSPSWDELLSILWEQAEID